MVNSIELLIPLLRYTIVSVSSIKNQCQLLPIRHWQILFVFACLVWFYVCLCFFVVLFSLLVRSTDQDKDLDAEGVYQSSLYADVVYQLLVQMTTSSKTNDEFVAIAKCRTPCSSDFSSLWEELVVTAHTHFERTKGVTLSLLM